ncbi:MAG TPA: nickel-dependent lactate racemase [Mycobacteriales bacterium]|nr:nickel-dependent lactate racemase [Mycobacteriales bacterium]
MPDTVTVPLAYGSGRLTVPFPAARTTVIEPEYRAATADPAHLLRAAVQAPVAGPPLAQIVRPGQRIAISVCDITRAQPRELMLEAVLAELAGVDRSDIVVLIATGTHRANTDAELRAMLGDEVVDTVRVVNHDARDSQSMVWCGEFGAGVPVWLNREWVEADIRITTGFVEPHFFAGFSGGPKMVAPGLAALDTVLTLHDAARIGDSRATWGIVEGNPVHDDVRAIAAATGVDFAFDVILNRDQEIVAAFAGELFAMHKAARDAARDVAMRAVPEPFDVVVTTNSGYPLDQNLYQAVKGISAAAQIVRPGGLIVCAAECRDGFPDHGSYRRLLTSRSSPRELLEDIRNRERTEPDQWQVQIQARIAERARIAVFTGGLSEGEVRSAHLGYTSDIAATVAAEGPQARICVLPEGPQTIPYVG